MPVPLAASLNPEQFGILGPSGPAAFLDVDAAQQDHSSHEEDNQRQDAQAASSGELAYYCNLAIHFTLVVNQAILGLAPLAAKIGAIERGLSKASGGVH